jgi:hypothetical protein
MAKAGYSVSTSADCALTATTAKTILFVLAPAQFGMDLRGMTVSFDGITNTDKPVLVEVVTSTGATNSTPGTANTNENSNIIQIYGRAIVAGFIAGSNCTSEPTVLVQWKLFRLTPNGGTYDFDFDSFGTPDNDVSKGFAIRCTAPTSAVNARATMRFERC